MTQAEEWATELHASATEVFAKMLGDGCMTAVCPSEPAPLDYAALVRFEGVAAGNCVVQCGPETARRLAEHLTETPVTASDPLTSDALGEISNMVAGAWKRRIAELAAGCSLSVPFVTTSQQQREQSPTPPMPTHAQILARRCYTFQGGPIEVFLLALASS